MSLTIKLISFKKLKTKHSNNGFSKAGRNENQYTNFKREEEHVNWNKGEDPDGDDR